MDKCTFCRQIAEICSPWEVPWSLKCAESVHKLLSLEYFAVNFFESGNYCRPCKGLLRDVDFMMRSVSTLEHKLAIAKQKIAKMLLHNFHALAASLEEISATITHSTNDAQSNANFLSDSSFETHDIPLRNIATTDISNDEEFTNFSTKQEPLIEEICFKNGDFSLCEDVDPMVTDEMTASPLTVVENEFVCEYPECNASFPFLCRLENHILTHAGWKPFKCTECVKSFRRKQHLIRHRNSSHVSGSKRRRLDTRRTEEHSRSGEDSTTCGDLQIGGNTNAGGDLQNFGNTNAGGDLQNFGNTNAGGDLQIDENTNAGGDMETHEGTLDFGDLANGGDFGCGFPGCDQRFNSMHLFNKHQPTHPNWKPFKCTTSDTCQASFRYYHDVLRHIKTVHSKIRTLSNDVSGNEELGQNSEHDVLCSSPVRRRPVRACAMAKVQNRNENQSSSENEDAQDSDFAAIETDSSSETEEELPPNNTTIDSVVNTVTENIDTTTCHPRTDQIRLKKQIKRVADCCYIRPSKVNGEVTKWAGATGELPTWESVLNNPDSTFSEETFEATFCYMLKLEQGDVDKNKFYACSMSDCHRRFKTSSGWKLHVERMHEQVLDHYACPLCDDLKTNSIISATRLDAHINKVHFGMTRPHLCPVLLCDKRFIAQFLLSDHMADKHPSEPYDGEAERRIHRNRLNNVTAKGQLSRVEYCTHKNCSYKTQYAKHMTAHVIKRHKSDAGALPYKCDICNHEFRIGSSYRSHVKNFHKTIDEHHVCQFCGRNFNMKNRLSNHIRQQHKNQAPTFSCSICTRVSFTQEECTAHEALHANRGWRCILFCNLDAFETKEELEKHVKSVHDSEKEAVCHVCGYAMRGVNAEHKMSLHLKSHSRDKTVKCRFCDSSFRQVSHRQHHEQMKHAHEKGVKSDYKCATCGEKFSVYQYYYRHCRNKHGSNPIPKFQRKKK